MFKKVLRKFLDEIEARVKKELREEEARIKEELRLMIREELAKILEDDDA